MTTTVLRMPADQHRRYHYSAGRMMRSGVHPRGVLGHQERVRPAVQDGPKTRGQEMATHALLWTKTRRYPDEEQAVVLSLGRSAS
jgi:hypothetical protein